MNAVYYRQKEVSQNESQAERIRGYNRLRKTDPNHSHNVRQGTMSDPNGFRQSCMEEQARRSDFREATQAFRRK